VSWATPIPRPPTATQTDAGRPGTTGKPRVRYGEQIWHGRIHTLSSLSGFVRHTQVFLDRIALCHPEALGSTAAPRSGLRAVNQLEPVRLLKQSTSPDRESRCPVLAGGRRSRDHVVAIVQAIGYVTVMILCGPSGLKTSAEQRFLTRSVDGQMSSATK
jgi:hypothetical protein